MHYTKEEVNKHIQNELSVLSMEEEAEQFAKILANPAETLGDLGLQVMAIAMLMGYRDVDEIHTFTKECVFQCVRQDYMKGEGFTDF